MSGWEGQQEEREKQCAGGRAGEGGGAHRRPAAAAEEGRGRQIGWPTEREKRKGMVGVGDEVGGREGMEKKKGERLTRGSLY